MIFANPSTGWLNLFRCFGLVCTTSVLHTTDGGRTWDQQLFGERAFEETLYLGKFDFVDAETGWFLLNEFRGLGLHGDPPQRTQLYRTMDEGGVPPTPTVQLPKVGGHAPDGESSVLPLALLLSGVAIALGAGGLALARRR